MFFKTAKVQVLAFNQEIDKSFTKNASVSKVASFYETNPVTSNDIKAKLEKIASIYKISSDPTDYIYVAVRALTADIPNENYDCFSESELLRFDIKHACQVYQTFNFKPHHVNHRSADPTQARGVILDSYYNTKNAEHFPEILVAVDKTKDKRLAEGIASGELNGFSMGCFQAGTSILMSDGTLKNIENIKEGDFVITHTGTSKKVVYTMERPHKSDIYEIKVDSIQKPFVVTEEHPFWMFDKEAKQFCWKKVKELSEGDYVTCPTNIFTANYNVDIQKARLFGYYLAEGTLLIGGKYTSNGHKNEVVKHICGEKRKYGIMFTIHKDEIEIQNEICSLIKSVTGKKAIVEQHRESDQAINIIIRDTKLANLFDQWGSHNAKTKKLSEFVLNWDVLLKAKMLGAYFNGDGHQGVGKYTVGKVYVSTASKILANQVYIMLLQLGIMSYLQEALRHPTPNGFSKIDNIQYQIKIGKGSVNKFIGISDFYGMPIEVKTKGAQRKFFYENYWCSPIKSIKKISYNANVYNFEVEDDHSYIANGVAVHNCSADFTVCSICNHKASSPSEFCNHIRFHKGKEFDGKVAFEYCGGVVFEEESSVDDPADKNALTQDVILASKKADMEKETEMLIVNKKLNDITNTLNVLTTNLTNGGEKIMANTNSDIELKKAASTEKVAQDVPTSDIPVESKVEKGKEEKGKDEKKAPEDKKKEDKADKDLKEFKEKKDEQKFKERTKEEYGIEAKSNGEKGEVNPYAKLFAERRKREAVDKGTKEYFEKYPAGFGKDYTKEIKKKKIGGKYVKLYRDVRVIPVSRVSNKTAVTSKYYLIANKDIPLYLVSSSNLIFDKKSTAVPEATAISLAIANSIGDIGLVKTMNKYKATKLQSLYAPIGKPSLVTTSNDDLRDDKLRKKPTEGPESDGVDDVAGKSRDLREQNVSDDGEKDMKMAMRKRVAELKGLIEMIDEASRSGKSDEEVLQMIDSYLKGSGHTSSKKEVDKKEAGVTDRAIRDYQKADKLQAEQDKDVLADGAHDLVKVKRDKVKADEVFAGGKDDMELKRDNVVDLKATKKDEKKEENPYIKLFAERRKKAEEVEHSTLKKEHGENVGNQKDWKDTSSTKWEEGQKEVLKESGVKRESKDLAIIDKKIFIERYSRALKVAAKRASLNLIDNELKTHMADVLTTETESYWGMDEDLAVQLIEESFNRGGDSYVASLIKEAESLFDMPEESFLMIEADVKNLNPVMAVVGSINESTDNEDDVNPLIERASKNNPIFVPKADSVGKYDHLKGILRERLI